MFWSFGNPLLLLLDLLARLQLLHRRATTDVQPYALFLCCGLLPWTWFVSSLNEAAGSLVPGGNLIKKVLFPAEILPIVSVLANMVHFLLALPILAGFLVYYAYCGSGRTASLPSRAWRCTWPSSSGCRSWCWCSCVLTTGLALVLSALTVHFRDVRDILANLLTFWFFATPIIYSWRAASGT